MEPSEFSILAEDLVNLLKKDDELWFKQRELAKRKKELWQEILLLIKKIQETK